MKASSFRRRLRAFQKMHGGEPSGGFIADLEFLENRDLDLSVRLGAVLGFNALMVTVGTHPISASPGAPLSIDAATHPAQVIASLAGVAPFVWSSYLGLRALLIGEEFDAGDDDDAETLRRHLLAAFIGSIDIQSRYLTSAIRWTLVGGVLTLIVWAWIMGAKMMG